MKNHTCFVTYHCNRPHALYRLMEKTHTGGKTPRMGLSGFEKAHTSPPYGFLPSADIGQVVYYQYIAPSVYGRGQPL
jgi:hypothetical protein